MNILFICKHNIFRSRVAEEHMKKISKHNISSGGLIKAEGNSYPLEIQKEVCNEFGLSIPNNSKTLSIKQLQDQDLIIIVADDIPRKILERHVYKAKGKIRKWNVKDVDMNNITKENIRKIIGNIIKKVEKLNKEIR